MNLRSSQQSSVDQPNQIRVAHLMFSLEPGGLENGVVNISNRLDRVEFKSSIICLDRVGAFSSRLRPDVEVVCVRRKQGFSILTVMRLAREIRRIRPHLIHTHNLGPLIYAVLARCLLLSPIPIFHGEHCDLQKGEIRPRRIRQRRVLYRFCRRVHGVSIGLKEHLISLGFPSSKVTAVVNGVDCDRFQPPSDRVVAKENLGIQGNLRIIGMVGRFIARKRHLLVLEAFSMIALQNKDCMLLLLGDTGETREQIISAIESHPFRDRILWVGHQEEPAPWYQVMDILVMPSSSEGLSNALLEAMACGVPGIAHPACGAAEVISDGENGILRAIETPDELAGVVGELLCDKNLLAELARRARETAKGNFSINGMVASYATHYREVAGQIERIK